MRVERFQEDNMRMAMAKVRAELGKDAVLISSRRVGGRTEVMAASDYDPEQLETEIKRLSAEKYSHASKKNSKDFVFEILSEEKGKITEDMPSLLDMQDELGRLRKLFEGELAQLAWRDAGNQQPNRLALLTRLETVGISRDIGSKMMEKILPCEDLELGWRRTVRMLGRVIRVSKHDLLNEGGVIAMLGSTGVGKTTTAAKIAAQFALLHGRNQVGFITTDRVRAGGQEQLISLGSSLGVPVQVANSRREMQRTLESFSERKLVIIDTAGISQRDTNLVKQVEALTNADVKIHPYLVLPATAQESVIDETIKAYSSIDLVAAIITKTDENGSIGPVMSGLIRHRLAAAFIGNGQRIPEDLMPAQAINFINNIVESYDESRKLLKMHKLRANRKKAGNV